VSEAIRSEKFDEYVKNKRGANVVIRSSSSSSRNQTENLHHQEKLDEYEKSDLQVKNDFNVKLINGYGILSNALESGN
jgi:hypothetical protein